MVWAEIITTFLGFVAVTITIVVSIRMSRQEAKIDVRPNSPKLEIRALRIKPFTNNYMTGIIKEQIENKNGTTFISFYPDDVEQGEGVPRPDLQSFIVKTEFIRREAEGDNKARRQTVIILPRSRLDLPIKLRSTVEGDELTKEGQLAFIESILGVGILAGDEALLEMMKKHTRTGITKATVKEIEAEYKKYRNINPIQSPPQEHRPSP
ncbi:MAG: hypothetical protein AAB706_00515 [Patescibacteria group bacterium]